MLKLPNCCGVNISAVFADKTLRGGKQLAAIFWWTFSHTETKQKADPENVLDDIISHMYF